jgi:hypothetical protein
MKKAIIILLVLFFLCVLISIVLFIFRGSIPFLKDINLGGFIGYNTNNVSASITPSNDQNYNATINNTNLDINSNDKTWSSDIPATIPEFKYGTIKSVNKISNNETKVWSIIYENISSNAYVNYQNDLRANGFLELNAIETSGGWTIYTIKDKVSITVVYSVPDSTANVTISNEP